MQQTTGGIGTRDAGLFLAAALLWGGGALATTFQAGVTPTAWSVCFRMAGAAILFFATCAARGVPLGIAGRELGYVALQGVLFFAVGFIAFYESTRRIPSGLSALVLSTSSIFAALAARAAFGTRLTPGFLAAAACGVLGIGVIFAPSLQAIGDNTVAGVLFALAAAVASALGTLLGARNQRAGQPLLATLAWATLVGALASAAYALLTGAPFLLDLSAGYVISLAYLAVLATFVCFLLYFGLVGRIGPGRAAYVLVTVPVIALFLSVLFENLPLSWNMIVGAGIVVIGNILILKGR